MKVTEVSPQKKNPKRFNVFLDGQFGFGADEDLVVSYRLLPGKEVSSEDLEKLLYEAEVGKLMERMYRLFNVRARSEKEVRDYLRNLSFKRKVQGDEEISELTVQQVVERLKSKGMIDDKAFARSWVDSRRRSKKLGPKALRMELIKKGIDKKIVDEIAVDFQSPHGDVATDEELARQALEKKMRIWKNLPEREFRKKATDFLLRKGFEYSTIKQILNRTDK